MNLTVCPKCNYARTAADSAPAWQCPSCGIAYSKFEDAAGPQPEAGDAAEGDLRVRTLSVAGGDKAGSTAAMVYTLVLLAFLSLQLLYFPQPPNSGLVMMWMAVSMTFCAFIFWLSAYRRLRTVVDVPTSTIAAAAQGYIELRGTAAAAPGDTLIGHLSRGPCVWYRFHCHIHDDNRTRHDAGERGTWFILRDSTGDCLIDANEAEVVCDRCQDWRHGHRDCREWSIRAGDPVYAIGYFSSGGAGTERHLNLKAAHALAAQERDKEAYAARYDANRDGKVDRQETAVARDALRRDAVRKYTEQGGVHTLGPSPDGRPFLLIGANHEQVASRYRRLAVAHLCVFLISLGFAAYLWKM